MLSIRRYEADTIKKSRFFHAIDHKSNNVTIKDVCEAENVTHSTGKSWLRQRKRFGDAAFRRTGRARSGRAKKMSSEIMDQMLNHNQNSVRDQSWPVQIEHFNLNVGLRTMQTAFNNREPRASRSKMAKVRTLNKKNRELRVQYGREHQDHTVDNFFKYVHWSDEAHFDPDQIYGRRTLREEGLIQLYVSDITYV